ncbi:hypothetical protein K3M67_20235 (plasmid) [Sphingobium sp. V4]|uniref:hypothetical protein n=1 Tax=Sphingobium sp. V4 TaxID=3038927 RepID=UPI002557E50F|nr:hypothetical protein [Sphingobium sp. V4]WIW90361.1 hypothetical protein K3M67_20235 [Sphingobium sp. V4]
MSRFLSFFRWIPMDWPLISRICAGVFGGYALTILLTLLVTRLLALLGLSAPEVLHATAIASFPAYAAIIMAIFHASSATRAWLWLLAAAAPAALILAIAGTGAAI